MQQEKFCFYKVNLRYYTSKGTVFVNEIVKTPLGVYFLSSFTIVMGEITRITKIVDLRELNEMQINEILIQLNN